VTDLAMTLLTDEKSLALRQFAEQLLDVFREVLKLGSSSTQKPQIGETLELLDHVHNL
jgi:hypothetical protein